MEHYLDKMLSSFAGVEVEVKGSRDVIERYEEPSEETVYKRKKITSGFHGSFLWCWLRNFRTWPLSLPSAPPVIGSSSFEKDGHRSEERNQMQASDK